MTEYTIIDYGIITAVVIGALSIFYKGLKEPIDELVGWLKRLLGGARDRIAGDGETTTIIRYE